MMDSNTAGPIDGRDRTTSRSTDWYGEGEARVVEAGGVRVTIRYVGRKGRRARIVIEAPGGAEFMSAAAKSAT